MSALSFQPTYQVKMRFDNIGGLKGGAAVKSSGVVVGRVDTITFDDKTFQALVTIDVDKKFQFPDDSSAKILTSGLLGEQYIGLEPGGSEQNLKSGDTIAMTQSAIVLENLISQFLYSKAADSGAASGASAAGAPAGASGSGSGSGSASAGHGAAFPGAAAAMGGSSAAASDAQ